MAVETSSDRDYACFTCGAGKSRVLSEKCPECGNLLDVGRALEGLALDGYTLNKYVARGFYGATYRALNRIGKQFALKIVPAHLYERYSKSFSEEITKYGSLGEHPNIAALYDAGEATIHLYGRDLLAYYIVMEWIDGVPLSNFLQNVPISCSILYGAIIDLGAAITRFEECNIWHNDLNAQNILVKRLSNEEIQVRKANSPYIFKIIDTGSAVFRETLERRTLDDLRYYGQHINNIRQAAALHPGSLEDEYFIDKISSTISSLLEENPARRISSAKDAVRAATQLYQNRFLLSLGEEATLSTPFDYLNANDFPSEIYINRLFTSGFPWIENIIRPAGQSMLITGPRGSGKTMILRSMRLKTRLALNHENDSATQIQRRILSDSYLAFFASARIDFGNYSLFTKLPDWMENDILVVAHFNLLYALEVIDTLYLSQLKSIFSFSRDAEFEFCNSLRGDIGPAALDLPSAIESIRALQAKILRSCTEADIPPSLVDGVFLSRLSASVRQFHSDFANKSIVYLLDDFSMPKVPARVQRALLPIIWNSGSGYTFRVSSHSESVELTDNRQNAYVENRDYRQINLGFEYIESVQIPARRQSVDDSICDIFARRSEISEFKVANVRDFLGRSKIRDIASEIRTRWKSNSLRGLRYCGWSTIIDLCSGDISYIIDIVGQMLSSRPEAETGIVSIKEQNKIIKSYARSQLIKIQDTAVSGDKLYQIALNFGKMSLLKLQYSNVNEGSTKRPAEYLRIEVEIGEGDEEARPIIADLLRSGIFIDGGLSSSSRGNPARRLIFRKLLTPTFPTTFRNRDTFAMTSRNFVNFAKDPSGRLRRMIAEERIPIEDQQPLLEGLFNPEPA